MWNGQIVHFPGSNECYTTHIETKFTGLSSSLMMDSFINQINYLGKGVSRMW